MLAVESTIVSDLDDRQLAFKFALVSGHLATRVFRVSFEIKSDHLQSLIIDRHWRDCTDI